MADLKQAVRGKLLARLRPGRNLDELLDILSRCDAILSEEHRRMLARLTEFDSVRVRELIVPRSDIVTVPMDTSLDEVARLMIESGYHRLPVYGRDLDDIQGVIRDTDVLAALVLGNGKSALASLIRPCVRASELQRVLSLLTRMKREGSHLAIVLDEYGGTAGLVTLSDILSEIVGPMEEPGDSDEEEDIVRLPDGSFVVLTRIHIEDFADKSGFVLPDGDYSTIGGMINTLLGHIPASGEKFLLAGFEFEILEAEPRRVLKAIMRPAGGA